jgi:hypothetical protein
MKKPLPLLLASLLAIPSFAENLRVRARFWVNDCSTTQAGGPTLCQIPQPWGEAQVKDLRWTEAATEGSATSEHLDIGVDPNGWGRLTLFHVFPRAEAQLPKYFQMRWEWVAPARSLCIESVRQRNPAEIPPMICSVWLEEQKKMLGVTLEFFPQ